LIICGIGDLIVALLIIVVVIIIDAVDCSFVDD